MANIRYQTTQTNIDKQVYRISIIDTSYSGSVISDFELVDTTLDYDSGSEENYTPIIGSQLTLDICLAKNPQRDDTTLFAFLKGMVQQNSQLYYIKVEKYVSGSFGLFWVGNIVQNQSVYDNMPIESGLIFRVIANDFGFLNNKPYEQNVEFTPTSISSSIFTYASHGFKNGQAIKFKTLGTISGVDVGRNYFIYVPIVGGVPSANTFQISNTYEDSQAGLIVTIGGTTTTMPNMSYADFSEYTLFGAIQTCLNKQGLGSDKPDLWNNINWFENTVAAKPNTNILREISTLLFNFYEYSDTINKINFIDVVKSIVTLFGCRLIQSDGKYFIIQLQNYTSSTSTFRNASTTITVNTRNTVSNNMSISATRILQGGKFSWQRPYTRISLNKKDGYKSFTAKKQVIDITGLGSNTYADMINYYNAYLYEMDNVYGGNGNQFVINFATKLDQDSNVISWGPGTITNLKIVSFTQKRHYFSVQIEYDLGATIYYLVKTGGTFSWSTTAPTAVFYNYTFFSDFNLTTNDNGEYETKLNLPPLPSNTKAGRLYVNALCHIEGAFVFPFTAVTQPLARYSSELQAEFLPNGKKDDKTTYSATLQAQPFDAINKDLPDLLLWDTDILSGKGTMTVNDTGDATTSWVVGSGTTAKSIYELIVINALALNYRTKQTLECTIRGDYNPHQLLSYDGIFWAIKRASYSLKNNQWNGEWFELTYNDTDIITANNPANNDIPNNGNGRIISLDRGKDGSIYDFMGQTNKNLEILESAVIDVKNSVVKEISTRGNNDNFLYSFIKTLIQSIPYITVTQTSFENGTAISSFDCEPINYNLKTNDKILICDIINGRQIELNVGADATVGDTTIYFDSITPTFDILQAIVLFAIARDADHKFEIKH